MYCMQGWMDELCTVYKDGWVYDILYAGMDGWMLDGCTVCRDRWMDDADAGWIYCMQGGMDGWMDG